MPKFSKYFLVFIGLMLLFTNGWAQSKSELEKKRAALQREISQTNKELQETRKDKSAAAAQVKSLKRKIELREELIRTINKEVAGLNSEINETSGEIHELENTMKELKQSYEQMILFAQRNQNSYQRLMYIFAATDFNQAMKRLRYLQQYSDGRKRQAAMLDSTQTALEHKQQDLESQKVSKTALLDTQLKEKEALNKERKEKDKLIAQLQDQEKKLRTDLANKQRAKKKLDNAIADLIKKEIEAAKKKAAAAGAKNVTSENVFSLTPEAKKLSAGFASNMGNLPWPVANGRITSSFGDHPHPELKGIVISNNGVDIGTAKGSSVRTVFDGEVSGVITIPGANSAVIIRHGEYLTVYSNLEAVFVRKGDKVSVKQSIGRVYTDPDDGSSQVHLEIWKGTAKLDPVKWLARN